MKIIDFVEDIRQGSQIVQSDLTTGITHFFYLQKQNIQNDLGITESTARYIQEKAYRSKYKSTAVTVEYGDYLVYRNANNEFKILRFTQEFNKIVVPSVDFFIIKEVKALLGAILPHELGKAYLIEEFTEIYARVQGNPTFFLDKIKNIEIDNRILEARDLLKYVPPGSVPLTADDIPKIDVRTDTISISNLIDSLEHEEIMVKGYFQRKTDLWADDVKSRLIETILVGIPIPPLYFDRTTRDKWLVVDGLQRISSIRAFVKNELKLTGLEYLPHFEGRYYKDFDTAEQRRFGRYVLSYCAIHQGTPRSVRYRIFKSINVSALTLNRQEIRYAINEDETQEFTPSKYIKELGDGLNRFIDIPEKGKERSIERMYERELALRYIAFCMYDYKKEYISMAYPDFLDAAMEKIYNYKRPKLTQFKENFALALDTLSQIFDSDVLFKRKMIGDADKSNSNIISGTLFEVWTYTIAQKTVEEQIVLTHNRKKLIERAAQLKNDEKFMRSIDSRYSDSVGSVKDRFSIVENLINQLLNDN
ncbi:MAG: hypothetical protein RLZZ292_2514 [Bacteroidota bacterium]|jgi:hypothetical protein